MSFTFGFSGEDLSDPELEIQVESDQESFEDPLTALEVDENNLPQELSLQETLKSLIGTRFTFNKIEIAGHTIYRRELFDIKHQLMTEDNADDEEAAILIGETQEDLKNQVYEGGLKSWECSVDAVKYLSELENMEFSQSRNFIELGCGTSLPSLYLFQQTLSASAAPSHFILSDFNKSVIRLVTVPNLLINWAQTLDQEKLSQLQRASNDQTPIIEDELEVTIALVDAFIAALTSKGITFQFISGSWCLQFLDLLRLSSEAPSLIVSSETIYSPTMLPVISELILQVLQRSGERSSAIVLAKDIYFGVGGSINEFVKYLELRASQGVEMSFEVIKMDSNLQRSIVIIE